MRQIVAIKSGPNWGNSGQIKRMVTNFQNAARVLKTGKARLQIQAVNGCCYGRDDQPVKRGYLKFCGQRFWSYISASETLYVDIIEPLGHQARERNEAFHREYSRQLSVFTQDFANRYCREGLIDWPALVKSGSKAGV